MSEPSSSHVGQQIGNYRLIRLLGQGGFADVYLGEHIFLKTQAAIKLLSLRLASDSMESFLHEAQTIAKLRHPHIVHVFECGIENGIPFLVMDYIPNGTLRQRHPRSSRLVPQQIVPYIQQIASALYYAHQQKFIHRDIKPENMLLGYNGEVLLSDFGLALIEQSSGSQTTKEMAGTIPYMAPEQLQGRPRIASDQYALGIVMYEWLCGERPFNGSLFEIISQHMLVPPPSLRQKVPALSPAIEQVVLKALAKDPAQRFENVLALSNALTNAVQDSSATFVPRVESSRQSHTLSPPAPVSLSTIQLPESLEYREQETDVASTGGYSTLSTHKSPSFSTRPPGYLATPSNMATYRPGEQNSSSGHYPPRPSGVALASFPAPQKRRGRRFWGVVCLLLALLLIASSATFLLIHSGIISGPVPPPTSVVSNGGITTTPGQTQAVQSATPSVTRTTSALGKPATQTIPSPTPNQVTPPPTGTPQTVTPTQTPTGFVPQYTIIGRTAQASLSPQISATVSAQCLNGEQMMSGGFYMSDRGNPVFESYPSASDTWTVTAKSGYANATLSVTVTCLQANFSAHIQIFSFTSSASSPNTFTCPAGSVLTGGGFRDYAARTEPAGNGWLGKPAFQSGFNYNYVLCATANLMPVAAQSTTFSAPPRASTGLQTLTCPAGSQLTGGGFTYDYSVADVYANVPRGDSSVVGWSVGVYNDDPSNTQTASVWAICVQIPATVH